MITLDVCGEQGFAASWPWTPDWQRHVDALKKTAGFKFSKARKRWEAEGPEALLDLERYGVQYLPTRAAQERECRFRERLAELQRVKYQPLSGELYSYQPVDSVVLQLQQRGLLALEMGLGKSKIALDAAVAAGCDAILVLAPKTLTYNWLAEVAKWHPELAAVVVPDAPKERQRFWASAGANVWIANYEKVLLADWPMAAPWQCVILDEVQFLKSRSAQRSKRCRQIAARARYVFGLSGTPLEMRPEELHGVLSVLRPSVLGDFWRFREQHLLTDYFGKVIGTRQGELLKERIAPWMIRRRKDEVLGLPPKLYNTVWVELSAAERREYERLRKDFLRWLLEQERDPAEANVLTQLLRLQQFTSSPALLSDGGSEGSKVAALRELLDEWPRRTVVFTRFAQLARRLADWLETPFLIAGEVPAQERVATVERFNDSPLGSVLVSTDAGAYGLNVTGADLVVHHDALWNPAKMWQREDRLHRIGQEHRVNVVNLVCRGTLDEGMQHVLEKRRELFHDLVDGAYEQVLKRLGVGSLRRLIEGRTS